MRSYMSIVFIPVNFIKFTTSFNCLQMSGAQMNNEKDLTVNHLNAI